MAKHRFKPGQSGNPKGKPKGCRNKATLAVQALLDGEAEEITKKCIEKAKGGDSVAIRLVMERLCPVRRDTPVTIKLPKTDMPEGMVKAMAAIVGAVATGDLTPTEGQALAGLIDAQRRAIETEDIERRVAALEQERKHD